MKKAKSDQLDPAAKEDALRIVQKIRRMPPNLQSAFQCLVNLLHKAEKSKLKAGGKDD